MISENSKKIRVESCLTLSMKELRKAGGLRDGARGTYRWARSNGDEARVSFLCDHSSAPPALKVSYKVTVPDGASGAHDHSIELDSDPCPLGGRQWYFRCPDCGRRVRNLHMPPTEQVFGCRICFDLTYRSVQESSAAVRALRKDPAALERALHGSPRDLVRAMRALL